MPLIAHDRSGFGGALATTGVVVGVVVVGVVWFARPSRALWEALLLAGAVGFGAAVGVHGLIGYLDQVHVGPALGGAAVFALGISLVRRSWLAEGGAGHGAATRAPAPTRPGSARPASG